MTSTTSTARTSNSFDLVRLGLATTVIFSHARTLTGDGDLARDPVFHLYGTGTSGQLAVIGFLIVSGYLISQSWRRNPVFEDYVRNRILRIAPGFFTAYWLSIALGIALVAGTVGHAGSPDWFKLIARCILLQPPVVQNVFPGHPFDDLNGSLWTIPLEAFCYVITPIVMFRRAALIGVAVVILALVLLMPEGSPVWYPRGVFAFLCGALYGLIRAPNSRPPVAIISASLAVLLVGLSLPRLWHIAVPVAATMPLIELAKLRSPRLRWDISYGVYLYAWPIEKVLIQSGLSNSWVVFAAALPLSLVAGFLSWITIERRALLLKGGGHGVDHPASVESAVARSV